MVKARAEKSCFPPMAAISGVIRSATSAVTTAPNATPMTTPTARSTTLPRSRKALNSRSIGSHSFRRDEVDSLVLQIGDAAVGDVDDVVHARAAQQRCGEGAAVA